eukprot:1160851-Pelagomonas_calceolata.AAC.1
MEEAGSSFIPHLWRKQAAALSLTYGGSREQLYPSPLFLPLRAAKALPPAQSPHILSNLAAHKVKGPDAALAPPGAASLPGQETAPGNEAPLPHGNREAVNKSASPSATPTMAVFSSTAAAHEPEDETALRHTHSAPGAESASSHTLSAASAQHAETSDSRTRTALHAESSNSCARSSITLGRGAGMGLRSGQSQHSMGQLQHSNHEPCDQSQAGLAQGSALRPQLDDDAEGGGEESTSEQQVLQRQRLQARKQQRQQLQREQQQQREQLKLVQQRQREELGQQQEAQALALRAQQQQQQQQQQQAEASIGNLSQHPQHRPPSL